MVRGAFIHGSISGIIEIRADIMRPTVLGAVELGISWFIPNTGDLGMYYVSPMAAPEHPAPHLKSFERVVLGARTELTYRPLQL